MMKVINVLISLAVVTLLCLLENLINTKKNRRIRQFFMIPISIVLMGIGIWICTANAEKFNELCLKVEFFTSADILAMNVALLLGFVILKLIIRPIITAVCKKNKLLEDLAFSFYHYDEEYDEWFLKKQWINFRKYFFAILSACIIGGSVFLGLTWAFGPESPLWLSMFPCAAIIVVNEIYGYINGQTKEEFEHSVMGDEADSRRVSNYYKLREILEKILPEPLLSASTGCEFIGRETPADLIKSLKESEDTRDTITAEYFDINGRYKTADVDCVQATLQMMHRRNVVFFNPFYRDLSMYITLPLVNALLSGKKCVVLCGRKAAADDVKLWLEEVLKDYSHMKSLWRVSYLSDQEPECEIGILTFTQIYDKKIINTNRDFLNETDFVLLIEPSIMLNTSQVALSIIAEEMHCNDEKPIYCICDRNTDGLIDTLSHLLHAEITDVVAMPVPRCNYTAMSWNVDGDFCRQQLFDKQTKYLGNGIELAAIAVKNQIPKVTWYSETKAPIKDIKWLAGQNYSTICRYMNLPAQQKNFYEKIDFVSDLWSTPKTNEQFVIAEDEFCNMFSMMRAYLSRGKNQTFVNVLSENYLLRDYMRCNRQMFMSNPNAVPSYVPDYAKTERNTILKLILMMSIRQVSDEEIQKEFHLAGIETDDVFGTLSKLLHKYTFAEDSIFTLQSVRTNVDEFTTVSSCLYSISDEEFDKYFSDTLKNAYYILEDEKDDEGYIDAKLFSHVTQTILPGQFVTYAGKYYMVKYVSPQTGVVLRRASDLFDSRKYYRQVRSYQFDNLKQGEVVSLKKVMDIEFAELRADFSVVTTGYLEMTDNHNLRTARLIDFSDDPTVANYTRKYRNKSVLRIQLPNSDEKIRFTICLLLSEVFKSVYPDGWQYLTAITRRPEDIDGILNYVVYPADGDIDDDYIYIIEDSDIDLGLLASVEKNYMKLMEIVADFLDWHFEKMREPASKDPVPVKISVAEAEEKKKRNLVVRMLDRIRKLFGGKKEEEVKIDSPSESDSEEIPQNGAELDESSEKPEETHEDADYDLNSEESKDGDSEEKTEEIAADDLSEQPDYSLDTDEEKEADSSEIVSETIDSEESEDSATTAPQADEHPEDEFEPKDDTDPDIAAIDGTDIFDNEGMPEDNDYLEHCFQEAGIVPLTKSRYQKECYLKYGFEEIDSRIQVDELRKYLRVRGWTNNSLTMARKREVFAKNQLDVNAVNHCDFCSLPLSGVSYERLNDGRVRCNDCSSSAITTVEEFKELFYRCLELMEDFYEIRYRVPIAVKTADARTVAKQSGLIFRPSTDVAPRVLGFAQRKHGKYSLLIENGSPRLAAIDTMVHEMTHIWQYLNWNDSQIVQIYGMACPECTAKARDIVYEGMAMWSSIQYLYQIGETYYAAQQEALAETRQDIYGIGFRLYREQYPLVKDSSLLKYSPFSSFPTLEPSDVYAAVKMTCTAKECKC